jgi:hypothetical protein
VAEHPFALAAVVARIMKSGQVMVNGFVNFDPAFFEVFLEQIVNTDKLDTFIGKPILQTKPGRIIGVASFG